jgi:uncharacterized caspase-like protein
MCLLNKYANKISMLDNIGKSVMRFPILMLCLFAVSSSVQAAQSFKRLALVIGNDYAGTSLKLKSPVRDAKAMTEALRKLGFRVLYQENANQAEMKRAIEAFVKKLDEQTDGLFYFSGHGVSLPKTDSEKKVNYVNYLVPNEKGIFNATTSIKPDTLISSQYVIKEMHDKEPHLNIVIFDACRSLPIDSFGGKSLAFGGKSLARKVVNIEDDDASEGNEGNTFLPTNLFVGYATLPNTNARESTTDNVAESIYTKHLLKFIQIPGLSITNLFDQVRDSVKQEYKQKRLKIIEILEKKGEAIPAVVEELQQVPEHLPLMEQEFYFAGKLKAPRIDTF